jgi:hypothetical protein
MKKKELQAMTVAELREYARRFGISAPSRLKKSELVEALSRKRRLKSRKSTEVPSPSLSPRPKRSRKAASSGGKGKTSGDKTPRAPRRTKNPVSSARNRKPPRKKTGVDAAPSKKVSFSNRSSPSVRTQSTFSAEHFQFPTHYDRTQITLIPRDPNWAFAYWSIHQDRVHAVQKDHPGLDWNQVKLTIRLFEFPANDGAQCRRVQEYFPLYGTNNYYIQVPNPGGRYFCELGFTTAKRDFIPLCRSLTVDLPAGQVSSSRDPDWINHDNFLRVFQGTPAGIAASEDLASRSPAASFSGRNAPASEEVLSAAGHSGALASGALFSRAPASESLFSPMSSGALFSGGGSSFALSSAGLETAFFSGGAPSSQALSSQALSSQVFSSGALSSGALSSWTVFVQSLSSSLLSSGALSSAMLSSMSLSSEVFSSWSREFGGAASALLSSFGIAAQGLSSFFLSSGALSGQTALGRLLFSGFVSSGILSSGALSSEILFSRQRSSFAFSSEQMSSFRLSPQRLFSAFLSSAGLFSASTFSGALPGGPHASFSGMESLFSSIFSSFLSRSSSGFQAPFFSNTPVHPFSSQSVFSSPAAFPSAGYFSATASSAAVHASHPDHLN